MSNSIIPFDANQDAQVLHRALNPKDKDALINVLCYRTEIQRMQICEAYLKNTGSKLESDLRNKTRANFSKLLSGLSKPYPHYLASSIYYGSTTYKWLSYILFTLTNDEIWDMKDYFEAKFNTTVEQYLRADQLDHINDEACESMTMKPIVKMLRGERNESDEIDETDVMSDVNNLMDTSGDLIDGCWTTRQVLKRLFYCKSFKHIKAVEVEYKRRNDGASLKDAVKKAYSFSISSDNIFNYIRQFSLNSSKYYAWTLMKSMKGLGTTDNLLIHVIIRRCEGDLEQIKDEFESLTGESLQEWVKSDTSRHYKIGLLALIRTR